ncbi:hypothetical protein OH799_27495 [Nocardia sp. NBC_00881]|uniref:hypothetical protein n=1 Tax=Nocardia sp. NBC_00881 TaxID=2975995 RepID=UPI00386BAA52|nr:hypothetical protein OH799_27495 [Nocardia sp. NBC_00881]
MPKGTRLGGGAALRYKRALFSRTGRAMVGAAEPAGVPEGDRMGQPLWIDTDELHASALELHQLAEETARMAAELNADLAREGECWGDDEPGKTFAQTYVPGAEQGMEGFENLAANLRAIGSDIRGANDAFENQDRDGGLDVNRAHSTGGDLASMDPSGSAYPRSTGSPSPIEDPAQQPIGSPPTAGEPTADNTGRQNAGPTADPGTDTSQQRAAQRQPDLPADPASPGYDSNTRLNEGQSQPTTSAPTVSAPTTPVGRGRTAPPTNTGTQIARTTSAAPSDDAPRLQNSSGTPWSKAPSTARPAERGMPPRVSPPRPTGRPQGPVTPAKEKGRTISRRPEPAAAWPPQTTDDEAIRIAQEMAARQGLEIVGFETAGMTAHTVQEIADAVDTVLTKHTIVLRGIEIAAGDGSLSRVENRAPAHSSGSSEATPSQSPEPWIVLDRAGAADPGLLSRRTRATARSTDNALWARPMYATMLLEFGHVLDLLGGVRARREVQRALITEYLRVSGAAGDPLGRVVGGYKRWRSQLSRACFDCGVLSPGRALAEGFATVELHGDKASGPAKALHRLLVTTARPDARCGGRGRCHDTSTDSELRIC